jgi:uncharacterized protein YlzI (FlbEa/FlbD family)
MSDFIELTLCESESLLKIKADKIESFYAVRNNEDRFINTCVNALCNCYHVKESPQEIIAKIEEWKSKRTVYERCDNCGTGAIPLGVVRY